MGINANFCRSCLFIVILKLTTNVICFNFVIVNNLNCLGSNLKLALVTTWEVHEYENVDSYLIVAGWWFPPGIQIPSTK